MLLTRWGHLVARRRLTVLVLSLIITALTVIVAPTAMNRLSAGGWADPQAESTLLPARLAETVGRGATDAVLLYSGADAGLRVQDPAFEAAVTAAVTAFPREMVPTVITYWNSGHPAELVSADGRSTYALIRLAGATAEDRMSSFDDAEESLRTVGAGLTVRLGGEAALNAEIDTQVGEDLARAEGLSLPILLVLLIVVFAGLVAAGLPLIVGLITVAGSLTLLRVLTEMTQVSVFAVNIITLLGLGLAIDYSLFLVNRFREELAAGRDTPEALGITLATAGRTVAFSGITVAVSLSSLLLFAQPFLKSMGYGGMAAVLVAMLTSLTLLPALLAILGRRVDALRIRLPRRRRTTGPVAEHARPSGWARLSLAVMRRPITLTLAVVAVLGVLALPGLKAEFGGIDARALPADSPGRAVEAALATQFPKADAFPIQVLVDGGGQAAATGLAEAIGELDGVTRVRPAGATQAGEGATLLLVEQAAGPVDDAALRLVRDIRALPAPDGARVLVGGATAEQVDLRASIGRRLPWMAGFMALATFLLLFGAFGSLVLPLKAIVTNLLSLAASFGVVAWIFGEGHLSGVLDFTPTGTIQTTQPILMLAIVFGLSMDYEVFLLSRVREQWELTGDPTAAVATGLQRTGRIITSAALLLVVVIAAFSTSGISFIKMLGVGMATAIAIDATIVRAVLVPATMRLLGRHAWWAPAPLARWQARHGFSERDDVVPASTVPVVDVDAAAARPEAPEPAGAAGR